MASQIEKPDYHSLSLLHPASMCEQPMSGHGGRGLQTLAKPQSEHKPGPASLSLLTHQVVALSYFCATPTCYHDDNGLNSESVSQTQLSVFFHKRCLGHDVPFQQQSSGDQGSVYHLGKAEAQAKGKELLYSLLKNDLVVLLGNLCTMMHTLNKASRLRKRRRNGKKRLQTLITIHSHVTGYASKHELVCEPLGSQGQEES